MGVGAAAAPARGARGLSETRGLHGAIGSPGSRERASAWREVATVPAELSTEVWPAQTKTHILIFFGFEPFKPKFKF